MAQTFVRAGPSIAHQHCYHHHRRPAHTCNTRDPTLFSLNHAVTLTTWVVWLVCVPPAHHYKHYPRYHQHRRPGSTVHGSKATTPTNTLTGITTATRYGALLRCLPTRYPAASLLAHRSLPHVTSLDLHYVLQPSLHPMHESSESRVASLLHIPCYYVQKQR